MGLPSGELPSTETLNLSLLRLVSHRISSKTLNPKCSTVVQLEKKIRVTGTDPAFLPVIVERRLMPRKYLRFQR